MNSTLTSLVNIDLRSAEQDKELLSVETKDGKRFLTIVRQSSLSYMGKKWAFLGFGKTSLNRVSHFLNSAEGKEQLDSLKAIGNPELVQTVVANLKTLNEKIQDIEKPRRQLKQANFVRVITIRLCQLIRFLTIGSVQIPLHLIDHLEKLSLKLELAVLDKKRAEASKKMQNTDLEKVVQQQDAADNPLSNQSDDEILRKLISRQLNLPKGQELDKIVEAMRKILESAVVEALKDGKNQLNLAHFQQLEKLTYVAREQANIVAVQDFFIALELDASINLDVKQLFKDEWKQPNGGIFGKEIKNNQEFFFSSKRTEFLNKAKEWSQTQINLQQGLQSFKVQLDEDIKQGRFVPIATQQVRKRYQDYFALSKRLEEDMPPTIRQQLEIELQKEFHKICNVALINQEIRRKGKNKEVGTFIEDLVLEQLGYSNIASDEMRNRRRQAEIDILNILLREKGLEDTPIENIQKIIQNEERKARLHTILNVEDQAKSKQVQTMVNVIETEFLEACKTHAEHNNSSIDKELDERLPNQARAHFLSSKTAIVDAVNQSALTQILEGNKKALRKLMDKTPQYVTDAIQLMISELGGQMYSGELYEYAVKQILGKEIEFYRNWMNSDFISMIQGVEDENQILGKGTCFAISTKLAIKEQKGDFDPIDLGGKEEDYATEIGDVQSIHRYRQALLGVSWKQADRPGDDVTAALFPSSVCKALKIKGVATAFVLKDLDVQGKDFEQALKEHAVDLAPAKGVAILSFWMKKEGAHTIYVRYDKANKRYHLFDPNVGLIRLKTESQFFFCYNDLMRTFYGDIKKLYCHRMDI